MGYNTHNEMILNHLQQYGTITSMEAITKYRITRLSACILNLREEGYSIESEWQSNTRSRWVKYVFGKEMTNKTKANSPKEMRKEEALARLRIVYEQIDARCTDILANIHKVAGLIKKI